jgi:hypothetical protein
MSSAIIIKTKSTKLALFYQDILRDPTLQQQLRAASDLENLCLLTVSLGSQKGYDFTLEELVDALEKEFLTVEKALDLSPLALMALEHHLYENQHSFISSFVNTFKVYIVDRNHELYQQGRKLAQSMYHKVWQTENLLDNNDYGVVVFQRDSVIANVNIQLKHNNTLFKSEQFFARQHWHGYLNVKDSELAEISGLAISDQIPSSLSRSVLMTVVLGLRMLLNSLGLKAYITIQHQFLIRVLCKSLNLPFEVNKTITTPQINVPNDNYWNRKEAPKIYYFDNLNAQAIAACNSLIERLKIAGIKTKFFMKTIPVNRSYFSFSDSRIFAPSNSSKAA